MNLSYASDTTPPSVCRRCGGSGTFPGTELHCPECGATGANGYYDQHQSPCTEAVRIVRGPRRKSYGDPRRSFQNLAAMWSVVLGHRVTPEQVALCMIWVARETNSHQFDNLVDICGYTELLGMIHGNHA